MTGEDAILWTVRASLALMTAGFAGRQLGFRRAAPACWAAGAGLMLVHLAAAFAVRHGWSHAAAVRETARQTNDLVGWNWGGGVWANYLFALVWAADALWWTSDARSHAARPAWVDYGAGAFLGFMAINGAVVFVDGPTRWIGAGACGLLLVTWLRRGRSSGSDDRGVSPPRNPT